MKCGVTKQGVGQCFIAAVLQVDAHASLDQLQLTVDIRGNQVRAIIDTSTHGTCVQISEGNQLLLEGEWQGKEWSSSLIVHQLSVHTWSQKRELITSRTDSKEQQLLQQLLTQLRLPLREFVEEVMSRGVGSHFQHIPASNHYHHHQSKGLLTHSLECALMAGQLALTWLNRAEAELTMVAALLHDIGKCGTHRDNESLNDLGNYVSHESYTLEFLSPALERLENQWRVGANLLRHMLSQDNGTGMFPAFPGTLLVKMADQFSTALNRRETLFQGHPDYHHYAYDGEYRQRYLRVPE